MALRGRVAQMVERPFSIREVLGSIPNSSSFLEVLQSFSEKAFLLPGLEPGLADSESAVITTTLQEIDNHRLK